MFQATVITTAILAAMLTFSAARKFSHRPEVVKTYARVGVPEDKLNYLAILLVLGAGGLIIGLFWAPLGVVAGACLVLYFILAMIAHIRARDAKNLPTPLVLDILAVAALVLRIATL